MWVSVTENSCPEQPAQMIWHQILIMAFLSDSLAQFTPNPSELTLDIQSVMTISSGSKMGMLECHVCILVRTMDYNI